MDQFWADDSSILEQIITGGERVYVMVTGQGGNYQYVPGGTLTPNVNYTWLILGVIGLVLVLKK